MAEKKKQSSGAGMVFAGLLGAAIGGIGTLIYKSLQDDKETDKGKGQKVPISSQENSNCDSKNSQQSTKQFEENENIFCPISFVPMTDPYLLKNCGHSFQKEAIDQCLEKKLECPLCRKQCTKDDLIPNFSLKCIVQDIMKDQKQ
ncbi:hypothetical protein ABPG74_019396 [Tetrahymena malaccensis]